MDKTLGEVIKFIRPKEYTFQRQIGQGGTGKTILIKDELTDINFVCKKYSPYDDSKKIEYFNRFVDEIKIMYLLSHPNVVRIYNYFLYSENNTGYILMEYIDGGAIDSYLLFQDDNTFENIFIQLIQGFEYLEKNNILHRDIRNGNILVTNEGIVKIIDFGFGKKIECQSKETASVLLNWPVSDFPDEIYDSKYNHQTEIYFVGKLFNKILQENLVENFRYQHIIDDMIITNPEKRIKSFSQILESLSEGIFEDIDFSESEKLTYSNFVNNLTLHIVSIKTEFKPITQPEKIIRSLEDIIKESLVEELIQDNSRLISCFVCNGYTYNTPKTIEVKVVKDFYKLLKRLSLIKQKIIIENINARLKCIPIKYDYEEIPF